MMKLAKNVTLLLAGCLVIVGAAGCRKKPQGTTPLPGYMAGSVGEKPSTGPILSTSTPTATPQPPIFTPQPPVSLPPVESVRPVTLAPDNVGQGTSGVPLSTTDVSNWNQDRSIWSVNTVYFDFDKHNIKPSEVSKIEAVAAAFKGMAGKAILVEGHCDERGTEEYNRALGERRALSVREYLIRLGVSADAVHTKTFGEEKPATEGHDESAWSKNRRGEFILLTPP